MRLFGSGRTRTRLRILRRASRWGVSVAHGWPLRLYDIPCTIPCRSTQQRTSTMQQWR